MKLKVLPKCDGNVAKRRTSWRQLGAYNSNPNICNVIISPLGICITFTHRHRHNIFFFFFFLTGLCQYLSFTYHSVTLLGMSNGQSSFNIEDYLTFYSSQHLNRIRIDINLKWWRCPQRYDDIHIQ